MPNLYVHPIHLEAAGCGFFPSILRELFERDKKKSSWGGGGLSLLSIHSPKQIPVLYIWFGLGVLFCLPVSLCKMKDCGFKHTNNTTQHRTTHTHCASLFLAGKFWLFACLLLPMAREKVRGTVRVFYKTTLLRASRKTAFSTLYTVRSEPDQANCLGNPA